MASVQCGLLYLAKALGLFALARRMTPSHLRVLCYHGAWGEADGFAGGSMFILPATFERRLDALTRLGYPVLPLQHAVEGMRGARDLPSNAVVITIDDGWHSTWELMVPAIVKRGLPATLYCDTHHLLAGASVAHLIALHFWQQSAPELRTAEAEAVFEQSIDRSRTMEQRLAAAQLLCEMLGVDLAPYIEKRTFNYMTPTQLRETSDSGIDVQLHTHNHTMHDRSPEAILLELHENREVLMRVLGLPAEHFKHFCYPSGDASLEAAATIAGFGIESGTTSAFGLASATGNPHLIPRIVDGDHIPDIKFEAELAGFMHLLRRLLGQENVTSVASVPRPVAVGKAQPAVSKSM